MSQLILDRVAAIGGAVFTGGDYNLNIVGIRSADTTPNKFNDALYVIYKERGMWVARWWPITTDPGLYWLENPGNQLGYRVRLIALRPKDRHFFKRRLPRNDPEALVGLRTSNGALGPCAD